MFANEMKSVVHVSTIKEEKENSKRSKNFKQSEIDVLLDLVKMKKEVLECKKTDQITQREKDATWKEIEILFNQQSGVFYREWRTLKAKYDNTKKVSKKAWANETKYVHGTGGGPNLPSVLTKTDLKIKEILGALPIQGNISLYDSDNVGLGAKNSTELESFSYDNDDFGLGLVVYEEEVEQENGIDSEGTNKDLNTGTYSSLPGKDASASSVNRPIKTPSSSSAKRCIESDPGFGSKYSVKDLCRSVSSNLKVEKKKKSPFETSVAGKKMEVLSKAKIELLELQSQVFQDQLKMQQTEHEIRVKCMLEKHEEEMKLIKLQVQNLERELLSKQDSNK